MVRCSLWIKRSAAKDLATLPRHVREHLVAVTDKLCDVSEAGSALKGEFEGLRVDHYRIFYQWWQSKVELLVLQIGHRKDVDR